MGLILFPLTFAGCKESKGDRVCGAIENRITECSGAEKLPRSAMSSMRRFCQVSMQYEPRPDDAPGNLAELTRTALEDCAAQQECGEFLSCLDRNRCQFILSDPSDTSPEFWCSPPATP